MIREWKVDVNMVKTGVYADVIFFWYGGVDDGSCGFGENFENEMEVWFEHAGSGQWEDKGQRKEREGVSVV